ncbi:hypothetical protein D9757_008119 [Collybiopsis confluens]|uniref:Pali-domain-containing protein n=1 Tax=Collybiopsis confluens TaxID=2823264 RepID=A0A8H5HEF4_9AGAR|nr:hypothetical protein D9757_012196 [Collybiopsis confluens]KAF5381495.1 hypothetical protein D9757_008119 [Collybiopsis confluens]
MTPLRISGIVLLFIAFFLNFLVSISLPTISTLEIAQVVVANPELAKQDKFGFLTIRYGIWAYCAYAAAGGHACSPTGHGYMGPPLGWFTETGQTGIVDPLAASWTRGLAIHPVASGFAFIAFCLVFTKHTLVTSLMTALAAVLTLLAYAVDIAMYAELHHLLSDVPEHAIQSRTGPGFWLTLVSLVLLIVAGVINLISHRKEGYPSYPMSDVKSSWLRFFKRN